MEKQRKPFKKVTSFLKKHKKLTALVVIVAIAVVFFASRGDSGMTAFAEETVQLRDIVTYNSFVGNIEAASDRSVISAVSQQVVEVCVEKGDTVEEGDIIAKLDTSTVEYNIALSEASIASSNTSNSYSIADAERTYSNYKDTLDQGLNSTVQSAENQVDSAYTTWADAIETKNDAETAIANGTYEATSAAYSAMTAAQTEMNAAQTALDAANVAVASAQAALDAAQANLDTALSQNGYASESDIAAEDTATQGLKTARDDAKTALTAAQADAETCNAALESATSAYQSAYTTHEDAKEQGLSSLQDAIISAQTSYNNAVENLAAVELQVEQQLETYEANVEKAKATAGSATSELELENLENSLEDYTIVASCSGTITDLNVEEGDMVSSGMTVATISDLDTMVVSIKVDEYSILNTAVGSDVTIYVDSIDQSYDGTLTWVADAATIENGVSYYEAMASLEADDLIRSGMSVEVRLTSVDLHDVVSVSANMLNYNDDNTAYVYVRDESGNVVEKAVTLGASDGSYVQVTEGLEEGDVVLSSAQQANITISIGSGE